MSEVEDGQDKSWNAALALLVVAVLFGGGSQQNALRLALVELASLPVLLVSVYRLGRSGAWRMWVFPLGILIAIAAVPLLQLVPLPPELWRSLPGREDLVSALRLAGVAQPWLPITLEPESTLQSAMALAPPAAMFLAVLCSNERQRLTLVSATLVLAVSSIVLGAAQVAGGQQSPLYLYEFAHRGLPIGWFSNRNHQAIFLLAALPMATLWVIDGRGEARRRVPPALASVLFGLLIVGVIATRSRAGLILLGPAIAGSLALGWNRNRFGVGGRTFAVMLGVILVAMLFAAQFLVINVLPRFDPQQSPEFRFEAWPQVSAVASDYLPLGSGIGTFDPVYRSIEPLALLTPIEATPFNHAHNEYLEIWLETGWMGVAVLLAFGVWSVRASFGAWKAGGDETKSLQRASAIVIGLLLAHSVVDCPVRTEAMATVFALACGLIAIHQRTVALVTTSDSKWS